MESSWESSCPSSSLRTTSPSRTSSPSSTCPSSTSQRRNRAPPSPIGSVPSVWRTATTAWLDSTGPWLSSTRTTTNWLVLASTRCQSRQSTPAWSITYLVAQPSHYSSIGLLHCDRQLGHQNQDLQLRGEGEGLQDEVGQHHRGSQLFPVQRRPEWGQQLVGDRCLEW